MITIQFKPVEEAPGPPKNFEVDGKREIILGIVVETDYDSDFIKMFSESDFDNMCATLKKHLMQIKNS